MSHRHTLKPGHCWHRSIAASFVPPPPPANWGRKRGLFHPEGYCNPLFSLLCGKRKKRSFFSDLTFASALQEISPTGLGSVTIFPLRNMSPVILSVMPTALLAEGALGYCKTRTHLVSSLSSPFSKTAFEGGCKSSVLTWAMLAGIWLAVEVSRLQVCGKGPLGIARSCKC